MANNQNLLKGGKVGHKGRTGRPPEWLKAKCSKLIEDKKLIEFLANVAAGEPFVEKISIVTTGAVIEKTIHSADVKDRIKAVEMLMDRGFGKPTQVMGALDEDGKWVTYSLLVRIDPLVADQNGNGKNGNGKNPKHQSVA